MPAPLHAFLDSELPLAFAHRGGALDQPENSMPAFEAAVALGYRYLETDVHASADGVLFAFHDANLDRVTDHVGAIADLPSSIVARARIDGREPIPLLEDILSAFPEAMVNIDAKADSSVEPLLSVVSRREVIDRVCVGSFSDKRLRAIRERIGPRLCTSAGPVEVVRVRASTVGGPKPKLDAACLQVPPFTGPAPLVTQRFVDRAHELGLPVHVWTIDERPEMERLLDLGVDGIMTDRPGLLRDVLVERDDWPKGTGA